jgi:glycosyltransferase involved in cell wall biosynthesis
MSLERPAISVVMPLYNKQREVGRAVASVLAQRFADFELVVVDDGSTDCGPSLVAAQSDPRIRLSRQDNAGVSAARNLGITLARAELVAFLDADDEWDPGFLETIVRLREKFPACRVFATGYSFRYRGRPARPALVRAGLAADSSEGVLEDYFQVALNSDPPLWTSAVAADREALLEVGGFPVGVIAGEDLLTWARLAVRFDIAYCKLPLASFWAPITMDDRPPRYPQLPDRVASGLAELLETAPWERSRGMRQYLALWHRMRAVVYLKLNRGDEARREMSRCAKLSGVTARLVVMQVLSRLPRGLPARLLVAVSQGLSLARAAIGSKG